MIEENSIMVIKPTINRVKYTVLFTGADNYNIKPAPSETTRDIIESIIYQSIVQPKAPTYKKNKSTRRSYCKGI